MKIALFQMDCIPNNPIENSNKIKKQLTKAASKGADFFILPELADSGYYLKDDLTPLTLSSPILSDLQQLAKEHSITLLSPFTEKKKNFLYNSIYSITPSDPIAVLYRKTHLFPGEAACFEKGDTLPLYKLEEFQTVFHICYDLRFPEWTRKARREGAELLIIPAAWPKARINQWKVMLQSRAVENQMYVIAVNRCGTDLDLTFGGHSMVIAPDGHIVAEAKEHEVLLVADIHAETVRALRKRYPFFEDCRPELY